MELRTTKSSSKYKHISHCSYSISLPSLCYVTHVFTKGCWMTWCESGCRILCNLCWTSPRLCLSLPESRKALFSSVDLFVRVGFKGTGSLRDVMHSSQSRGMPPAQVDVVSGSVCSSSFEVVTHFWQLKVFAGPLSFLLQVTVV